MQKGYRTFTNFGLGTKGAVLYDTTVVKIDDKKLILNNGGYVTRSTCKAINTYLSEHLISGHVSIRKGEMILTYKNKVVAFQNNTVEMRL